MALRLVIVLALLSSGMVAHATEMKTQVVTGQKLQCTVVSDFDALKAGKASSTNFRLGTSAIYADTIDGGCLKLDVLQANFEATHSSNVVALKLWNKATEHVKRETAAEGTTPNDFGALAIAAIPGCGQACDDQCLSPCTCRRTGTWCDVDGVCWDIMKCKG